ncbi:hypothetical protein [Actinoplanes sp. NPDC023714]|uniref:hypothetical protein n=1 Tax=Actinoplanes sp. NPDC023714 TaxID=3154322 RepID=UPI0033D0BC67
MPFGDEAVRVDVMCGRSADGRWWCDRSISVKAEELRRIGLHPDQPSAVVDGSSPPQWWHAEAERRFR